MLRSILEDPYKLCLVIAFLHVFADFNLQIGGRLHDFKCKQWWLRAFRDQHEVPYDIACRRYGRDYIVALALHSVVWSIVTFLPLAFRPDCPGRIALMTICLNAAFHGYVDHLKANRERINLIVDQFLHLVQIAATVAAFWYYS